jgi:predicted transcriptional regulator
MGEQLYLQLSRRESQIMAVVYRMGEASVADVVTRLPDRPGYNTIRNTMAILERKGYLLHRERGQKYVYQPVGSIDGAKHSAAVHLLDTFFAGSLPQAVQALLGTSDREVTDADLDEIARLIDETRRARG